MNREAAKTGLFAAAGILAAALAAWVQPESYRPDVFSDQGEPFFDRFRDVMAVKAIEVVDYSEAEATARPLKAELRRGRWILSSHNDYPAEARDRLAKTAGELIDLKKEIVASDRFEDHGRYGVIDPLDARNPSLTGRGKRVTLRDAQGEALAELVLGEAVKERPGYRYMRMPGQKRTYAAKTAADPSARFEDWVEGNLLRISAADVRKMTLNSYSIDEAMGRLMNVQRTTMTRGDKDGWRIDPPGKMTGGDARAMLSTLANLRVAGVRPKPGELGRQLKTRQLEMTLETVMSLRQRGFFITPDGRLLANEGELVVETSRGLLYTLRFGEVVTGGGDARAAGAAPAATPASTVKGDESRYVLVTVNYNPKLGSGADGPGGEQTAATLDARFADWYYVISGSDFARLRGKK